MKVFLTLLLVNLVYATLEKKFQDETKHVVASFVNGLQSVTPLHIILDVEDSKEVQRLEINIKRELKKHIENAFERVLRNIENAIANNNEENDDVLRMLKELRQKRKDFNIQDHKVEDELEIFKSKIDHHVQNILKKRGILGERSIDPEIPELLQGVLGDISIRDMFSKLKNWILEKLDVKSIREAFVKIIGQASKKLCEWVTTKGQEKVIDFFDRFIGSDSEKKKRTLEDRFLDIKDYLKNIEENIDKKLEKFKKWLDDLLDKGMDEAKEKFQNIAEILKEVIQNSKKLSKKRLEDILEHMREFEDKFGSLDDIRNLLREIIKNKN